MMGTCRPSALDRKIRHTSTAADHGQIEIQDDEVGRLVGHRLERRIAAADDTCFGVARALERVFDQAGDVVFVFDDEHVVSGHSTRSRYRPHVSSASRSC